MAAPTLTTDQVLREVPVMATYSRRRGLRPIAAPSLQLAGPFVRHEAVIGRAWIRPSRQEVVAIDIRNPRYPTVPELRRALGEAIAAVRRQLRGPQLNDAIAYLQRQFQAEQVPDAQAALAAAATASSGDAPVRPAEEEIFRRRREAKQLRRLTVPHHAARSIQPRRWRRVAAVALGF